MFNLIPSARTAAQKSSKCSSSFRQAPILAILMLAAGLSLSSCGKGKKITKTILSKSPTNFFDFPLPNGYCRFRYKEYENEEPIQFDDSCNKYNIGDTLK